MDNIIAGLDIGTSKVSAVLAKLGSSGIQILGVGISPNNGVKKGVVVDIESTTMAVEQAVEQLCNMTNMEVDSVFINISGGHVNLYENRGVIAVTREDREITGEDVRRVMQAARIFALPPEKEIVDVIPLQFIVDGYDEIRDPVGMFGTRLEMDAGIVTCSSTTLQNLIRSVQRAGLNIEGVVAEPLALGEVLLTKDEKELGVLIIDVGAGKTEYSVFENGMLKSSGFIPVGGDSITNDLAVGLRISYGEAENLKKQYGIVKPGYAQQETVPVKGIADGDQREVSVEEFCEIIEARVYEIFFLVNRELVKSGIKNALSSGVVITGGGVSFLKGCKEVAQEVTGLPVRIGIPEYIGVSSPVYSSGVGIVKYLAGRKHYYPGELKGVSKKAALFGKPKNRQLQKGGTLNRIKDFLDEYF
ncbi:MAG: cell division protein FtsA [Clostridiales bacterium]|nr:cell division protein FtsA [Clostridiales bacterium]